MTPAQLHANQTNAQKSTGPNTAEGKKRSSINARRHGLTGQFVAMSEEDRIAFDKFCAELLADYNPQTARERLLAISIAQDHWRLHRARAIENNIYCVHLSGPMGDNADANRPEVHTAAVQAETWLKEAHSLQLLTLYESRIRRVIAKNEQQLAELQAARKAAFEAELEQARLLQKLAESENETFDTAAACATFGFVFSPAEIAHRLHLEARLERARRLVKPQPATPFRRTKAA